MGKENRRKFLKKVSYASALSVLAPFDIFLRNSAAFANADSNFAELSNYYSLLHMRGAPPRWMFDLILKTNPNEVINPNRMVITKFNPEINLSDSTSTYRNTQNRRTGDYETYDDSQTNLSLPHLWGSNVKTANGESPAMDIARNWISVRGVDVLPVHPAAQRDIFKLPNARYTTTSFVVNENNVGISPIHLNLNNDSFLNKQGISNVEISLRNASENPFRNLLDFMRYRRANLRTFLKNKQKDLINRLKESSKIKRPTMSNNIYNNINIVDKVFNNQIDAIIDLYPGLFQKYKQIVESVYTESLIPGVDDLDLVIPSGTVNALRLSQINNLRGQNLKTIISNVNNLRVDQLCATFSMLELSIKENLSSSISSSPGTVIANSGFNLTNDLHGFGSVITLLACSKYYLAFLSCLTELKISIGEKFNKTLIQFQGEFNRTPRANESGSDHDTSNVISFFTGKVSNGPYAGGAACLGLQTRAYEGDFGAINSLAPSQVNHKIDILDSLAYFYSTDTGGREPEPAWSINNGNVYFSKPLRNYTRG